jgi:hypothetical protein
MTRVLMIANDSLLADGMESLLAQEIDLDIVQVTYQELVKGDDQSVLIVIDEGPSGSESINVADLFRDRPNLIVIMLSLESRNIYIFESYQLDNPEVDQVIHVIREFSRLNLKKNPDEQMLIRTSLSSSKEVPAFFYSYLIHLLGRKSVSNVTLSPKRFAGSNL